MEKWVIGCASAVLVTAAAHVWLPASEDRERLRECLGPGELRAQHGLTDTAWETRGGINLVLCYDEGIEVFTGTLTNTMGVGVPSVEFRVHLSNGIELGPSSGASLAPGQVLAVMLNARGQRFTAWSVRLGVGATARPLSG